MRRLVVDIEANGFKPTEIFCIGAEDVDSGEVFCYRCDDGTLNGFKELINEPCELIMHNGLGYDCPVMERLMGIDFSKHKITDTLVMSRLANPSREGGHSLKNLSRGTNEQKTEYHDFSKISDDMVVYMLQDVKATVLVYKRLLKELNGFAPESIDLEHDVQKIIQRQIRYGWLLDQRWAFELLGKLKQRMMEIEDEVRLKFKPMPVFIKLIEPKYKKDGTLSSVGLKFLGDNWENVGGAFSRIEWPEFNLGSRRQIGLYLQAFGWKPEKFTDTGQPIVDEKVLSGVKGIPEATLIAEFLLVQKRIAQVTSWLDALDEDDNRVHGYVNSNGAVTGRMTHSSPNLAQVPAVYSEYGADCRSCWIVPKGYKLVGADASGLELRMLAHYMADPEYTKEILHGDVHTANQIAAGLDTRDQAKTFIYAFLYGAGDAKIGTIVGGTAQDGRRLKDKFLSNTPALGKLREAVAKASARGYLFGLDGRKVYVRSEHAALNTLLQSAGAIVMKKALCILDDYATQWGLTYEFVCNCHDEWQVEVLEKDAERFGYLAVESIKAAGLHFNLRCPLDGEYKIGNNWAETH